MSPHPSTILEIQRYYQNEPKFNGVCSGDILTNKIKNKTYVINLGEYAGIGIHWITLYANNNAITYFDSFRAEYIRKKVKGFIEGPLKRSMNLANNFRIQTYDSVMYGYFALDLLIICLKVKV